MISDPSEFTPNLHQGALKYLEIHLQAYTRHFREFGTIPGTYPNPPSSKPWAIAQAFCSKSADFGPFQIHPKSSRVSFKWFEIHFQAYTRRFREFGTIPGTYPNPPSSKPWAIAQAFCSNSDDFGPFRIHPKSSLPSFKVVGNPFPSIYKAFQRVWNDSRHIPKSAIFKTMGYSPGFLLKMG